MIKKNLMQLRLNKELLKFQDPYTLQDENIVLLSHVSKQRSYQIKLVFSQNYPFTPPTVYIDEKIYPFFGYSTGIFEYYHKLKKECICCENILCGNNWSPATSLSKLKDVIVKLISDLEIIQLFKKELSNRYEEEIISEIISFHL